MNRPEARQPEPPPGEWLFKLQGEIFGPVPAPEIIEKMYSGEVDESTEISLGEGDWRTIQAVPDFHPFLFQAKARIRAEKARAEAERAARRRYRRNVVKVALGALALVVVSFLASYFLIVSRPWRDGANLKAWASKHVPLLSVASAATLGPAAEYAEEVDDNINIDQILIDDAPALVAIQSEPGAKKRKRTVRKPPPPKSGKPGEKEPPKTASLGALTNDEITEIVYSRRTLGKLYSCIRSEIRRNPELPSTIVIEFTISNDGRAGKVRMDNIKLDGSNLHKCFARKVAALKFRAFNGQVRNVTMPFNIKK